MAFGKLFGGMAPSKILWEPPLQGPWSAFCCSGVVQTGTGRRAELSLYHQAQVMLWAQAACH